MTPAAPALAAYLEVGTRRVFACAVDWPGWCRSGKTEDLALEALGAYAPRYARVADLAGVPFPATAASRFTVVERVPGNATTDFGAPGAVPEGDAQPVTAEEADRLAALLRASWAVFDTVVEGAPAELRKGPRGGGRDRDKIVDHVLGAEVGYARQIGLRHRQPQREDAAAVQALRLAILEVLGMASTGAPLAPKGWPARYAARRIAWHALDHAWEIEDRSDPAPV
ncbi:MAG: hypothetical protein M3314_13710 [Actinomycetota bacterium]|nr:hypothetical protein [Actinomycetota bacterium]